MQVSVVIPVYKAERFVAEAVRSALEQPETAEVVLVEDGSPDGSPAVCRRLADEHDRVRLVRHPGGVNRGAGASRNLGIREARFPFVSFLDADDLYLPGRFRAAAEVFAAHPEADGVYGAVAVRADSDEMNAWKSQHLTTHECLTVEEVVAPERLFDYLLEFRHRWHTNGITIRRAIFERTGLFDEDLPMCQDTAMWFKMAAVGTLLPASIDEPIAVQRLHGANRIVLNRDLHHIHHLRMLGSLAAWARRQGLPEGVQHRLLERQFLVWNRKARPHYRFPRLPWVAFLVGLPRRQPCALRNRTYYAHLRRAIFGMPRAGRLLGLFRPSSGGSADYRPSA